MFGARHANQALARGTLRGSLQLAAKRQPATALCTLSTTIPANSSSSSSSSCFHPSFSSPTSSSSSSSSSCGLPPDLPALLGAPCRWACRALTPQTQVRRAASSRSRSPRKAASGALGQNRSEAREELLQQVQLCREHNLMRNLREYTVAIGRLGREGLWQYSILLLEDMKQRHDFVPDSYAWSATVAACEAGSQWEVTLQLVEGMSAAGLPGVPQAYSAAISAAGKGLAWDKALLLLQRLRNEGKPNVIVYNSTITALARSQQWQKAMEVMALMKHDGIRRDIITYNALIKSCEHGHPDAALQLMADMEAEGLHANVVTYNTSISVCDKSGRWDLALQLLDRMRSRMLEPTVISCSSVVQACVRGKAWQRGLSIFENMAGQGVEPNEVAHTAAISALAEGRQWEAALSMLNWMHFIGLRPDVLAHTSAIQACHGTGEWEHALAILASLDRNPRGPSANEVTMGAAMAACQTASAWQVVLVLMDEMQVRSLTPSDVHKGIAIDALKQGSSDPKAARELAGAVAAAERKAQTGRGAAPAAPAEGARSGSEEGERGGLSAAVDDLAARIGKGELPTVDAYRAAVGACVQSKEWELAMAILLDLVGRGIEPTPDLQKFASNLPSSQTLQAYTRCPQPGFVVPTVSSETTAATTTTAAATAAAASSATVAAASAAAMAHASYAASAAATSHTAADSMASTGVAGALEGAEIQTQTQPQSGEGESEELRGKSKKARKQKKARNHPAPLGADERAEDHSREPPADDTVDSIVEKPKVPPSKTTTNEKQEEATDSTKLETPADGEGEKEKEKEKEE
eukprot:CAMPEP_0206532640 /NCGR_PEP_ID=MMETSP0325_2-20121206/4505_1 /ASSEMBLY_ACC=CAM_ASM_000347 /TAXON_ID=2866 /ORGANISM="Crypthecodinium cohnii, Strain Seligo" /LENGTH=808 /DNA_ID=CAMNT_0054029161 /DNA_START=41 /DNA_END=2464 /DNA_ORIENTATION=-